MLKTYCLEIEGLREENMGLKQTVEKRNTHDKQLKGHDMKISQLELELEEQRNREVKLR